MGNRQSTCWKQMWSGLTGCCKCRTYSVKEEDGNELAERLGPAGEAAPAADPAVNGQPPAEALPEPEALIAGMSRRLPRPISVSNSLGMQGAYFFALFSSLSARSRDGHTKDSLASTSPFAHSTLGVTRRNCKQFTTF